MFLRYANKRSAFTILELIIIISILGILIAIAVPKLSGFQQNTKLAKANKEVATITAALESYYTFNSHLYPPSTTTLQALYLINATPKMLSSIVYDPFAGTSTTEYNYLSSSNGQYYVIWSSGLVGSVQPTGISSSGVISY